MIWNWQGFGKEVKKCIFYEDETIKHFFNAGLPDLHDQSSK
jgi:hypothetical protein